MQFISLSISPYYLTAPSRPFLVIPFEIEFLWTSELIFFIVLSMTCLLDIGSELVLMLLLT